MLVPCSTVVSGTVVSSTVVLLVVCLVFFFFLKKKGKERSVAVETAVRYGTVSVCIYVMDNVF